MKWTNTTISALIFVCACLIFFPFLGRVHLFDWDEINFAECAREMIVSGNYSGPTIDFLPFWEKPPLFIWLQVFSMKIFGINEFAARFPNALCGVITLVLLFNIGTKVNGRKFGIFWVLAYAGSLLPFFYFKSGIIDPWFNLFIFLGIYFFVQYRSKFVFQPTEKNWGSIALSATFIGLAILTKGPVALLISCICLLVYWGLSGFKKIISLRALCLFILVIIVVGGSWFVFELITNYELMKEFITYQIRLFKTEDAGHGGPVYYHFIVLVLGCFPASVFAIAGFKKSTSDTPVQASFKKWMMILLLVVLILFSIVKTKIVHYSSLCYFPLTYLAAYTIHKIAEGEWQWKKWMGWMIGSLGITIGLVLFLPPVIDWNKEKIISANVIADVNAVENLKAAVHWSAWDMLPGVFYVIGVIIFLFAMRRNANSKTIPALFVLTIAVLSAALVLIVPNVEKYSQAAAIEFYEQLQEKDCYVATLGFKSYAQLFYSNKQPASNPQSHNAVWLLEGDVDKTVFFVSKIDDAKKYDGMPQLKELYRKNGFVFYQRKELAD